MLRKAVVVACFMVFAAMALSASMTAQTFARTNYISINRPVRLPGTVLPSGNYIFELPDPIGAPEVVTVRSADRHRAYYTGITQGIHRPAGLPDTQILSFAEARADAAAPIRVWWPIGESMGREFIYATGK